MPAVVLDAVRGVLPLLGIHGEHGQRADRDSGALRGVFGAHEPAVPTGAHEVQADPVRVTEAVEAVRHRDAAVADVDRFRHPRDDRRPHLGGDHVRQRELHLTLDGLHPEAVLATGTAVLAPPGKITVPSHLRAPPTPRIQPRRAVSVFDAHPRLHTPLQLGRVLTPALAVLERVRHLRLLHQGLHGLELHVRQLRTIPYALALLGHVPEALGTALPVQEQGHLPCGGVRLQPNDPRVRGPALRAGRAEHSGGLPVILLGRADQPLRAAGDDRRRTGRQSRHFEPPEGPVGLLAGEINRS